MKKLILTAALASATALSGFSQGQIIFQNAALQAIYFNSTASTANKVAAGPIAGQAAAGSASTGVVDVGLWWSTAAFTDYTQATLAQTDLITGSSGLLAGGTIVVNGTSSGEQIYVQVYAWDSTYANPDAAKLAGAYFGAPSAGPGNTTYGAVGNAYLTTGLTVSPAPGTPIFGTGAGQFGRTVLLQGPEPTTIAIGGLGAAALLMMRRRKK